MEKQQILEILDTHLFSETNLNERKLAEKLNISEQDLRAFFMGLGERLGFFKDGKNIYIIQEIIRSNLEHIHEVFWDWYVKQVPASSELSWQEGGSVQNFSIIKVISHPPPKKGIFKNFNARIVILGEENCGKQSFIYAMTGQSPNQPAPGVFFSKITRYVDNFIAEFETVILQIPPDSTLWLYAKAAFGVILFYDLTRIEETFPKLQNWLDTFLKVYSYPFPPPVMLLGTKLDKVKEQTLSEHNKALADYKAFLEQEYGMVVHTTKISLTQGTGVAECFDQFAKIIREWYIILKEEFAATIE